METFQEHYLSMKRTIAARKLNVDMALIDRAVDYAREKHQDQKRKDGSPYIIHPLAVAEIVAEIGLDTDAILGALRHAGAGRRHRRLYHKGLRRVHPPPRLPQCVRRL